MDKEIRNKLRNIVTQCRTILERAIGEILQGQFGIHDTGLVEDAVSMVHLSEDDRKYREQSIVLLEHIKAGGFKPSEAVQQLIREAAFTHLNRLCAYKMMELRGLIRTAVSKGIKSQGFMFYMADHLEDENRWKGGQQDLAYRHYLLWLGSTFASEIPALFSEHDPANRLFPPQRVLDQVLALINSDDLREIWTEDETIGWIYQYYNDLAERKQMREDSAAPRNSREMAVRNQFFTPRYVVEFLTDNTLGRIWYEMTEGRTRLKEQCVYLVRTPDEVFLSRATSQESAAHDEIEMARILLEGNESTLPPFDDSETSQQRLRVLAGCTNGYARHPLADGQAERWLEEMEKRVIRSHSFTGRSTQDLMDVLFLIQRREHHASTDYKDFSHEGVIAAGNYIRQRVLSSHKTDLSQEQLFRLPVFIPNRRMKDPRTILMLDPACGSMHFGLYAFDLFKAIYEEAWDFEAADTVLSNLPAGMRSLHEVYPTKQDFLKDVPRLIIEYNLHGIDIDPRCTQIAGLSLWLRAQREWKEMGLTREQRFTITRSNIVCAEPMPGEKELLRDFVEREFSPEEQPLFQRMLNVVWEKMELAGEAGSLVKIEQEIRITIAEAKALWKQGPKLQQAKLFAEPESAKQNELKIDLTGITDEQFWDRVEERIYDALRNYAQQAGNDSGFKRLLFADDAARGFAFIDLCRKRFDVALMNPPFGLFTDRALIYAKANYANASNDLYAAFVQRGLQLLSKGGTVGILSSRLGFYLDGLKSWREDFLGNPYAIRLLADLGYGVLDAVVETAAYVIDTDLIADRLTAISALTAKDKQTVVESQIRSIHDGQNFEGVHLARLSSVRLLPGMVLAYWLSQTFLNALSRVPPLKARGVSVYSGLQTDDDFRFLRLWWECPNPRVKAGWIPFAKGGEYQPYADDLHLCVNWRNDGAEMKEFVASKYVNWSRHIKNTDRYFMPGLTYSERTTSDISVRAFPKDAIFSVSGPVLQFRDKDDLFVTWAYFNCRLGRALIEMAVGSGDSSRSGTAARHYRTGILADTPCPYFSESDREIIRNNVIELYRLNINLQRISETHALFDGSMLGQGGITSIAKAEWLADLAAFKVAACCSYKIDQIVCSAFGVSEEEISSLAGPHPCAQSSTLSSESQDELTQLALLDEAALCARALERGVHPRTATKKTFFFSRELELLSAIVRSQPEAIVAHLSEMEPMWERRRVRCAEELLSRCMGWLFGRWDIKYATGSKAGLEQADPFSPLPTSPPGMLLNQERFPVAKADSEYLKTEGYPLEIPWDGILVDDCDDKGNPAHELDIERRARAVIEIVWPGRGSGPIAESVEQETCKTLGVKKLREYFRKCGNGSFWLDHLGRYSKSRRNAPIYWLLQSARKNYALWLYYHRLDRDTLSKALVNYVEPKLRLENNRLQELRAKVTEVGTAGSAARDLDRKIERQDELISELSDFQDKLRRAAELHLEPDLNDGVVLNIAPLWELVPWKEPKKYWDELMKGEYEWSSIAKQLKEKGLISRKQ